MSGNGKDKLSNSSGSKNNISTTIEGFEDKLIFWSNLIIEKYEDPDFYILQHEHNKLFRAFLNRENVFFSPSKIFTYKGQKFECKSHLLMITHQNFETTNQIVVFHDFIRGKRDGELRILATPIVFD
jgi:hypothetical protein